MTVSHRRAIAALLAAVLFVAVAVLAPDAAYSAGGALDVTFDTDGSTTLDFGNGTDSVTDLALQTDGKVVVVGPSGIGFGLARYTTGGALDSTFGSGGFTFGSFMTDAREVLVQSDGKIVVVGRSASTNGSLVVARYTATGGPDLTFDTDGRATVALTGANSGGVAGAIQGDGKIVALAIDSGALSIFRYLATGALDTAGWGTSGRVTTTATPSLNDRVVVQTDSKVVITGGGAGPVGGMLRFTTAGVADTFGTAGVASTANHVLRGLVQQSDGKLVGVGDQGSSTTTAMVVRRNADGSLDTGFGTSGVATFSVTGLARATARAVALQSDGKIIVTGRLDDTPVASTVFIARLTTAGVLDTTFATGGIATFSTIATKSTSSADGLAVDSTGRYVVGGTVLSGSGVANDNDFVVFRVLPTDTLAPTTTTTSSTTTTTLPGQNAAGSPARSDPSSADPSSSDGIVVAVQTPVTGVVTFTKGDGADVDAARVISGVTITVPAATAVAPHRIDFSVDASSLPPGFPAGGVLLLRDGADVADCIGALTATPDPCVASRRRVGDVIEVTAYTSMGSLWQFIEPVIQRVAGETRIASAVAASRSSFDDGEADAVVVARADGFADALAAAPFAAAKHAPLLLSQSFDLDDIVLEEITRVLPAGGTVYLLGGTSALGPGVELRVLSWGYEVVRLAGVNRYETAVEIAETGLDSPDVVVETTGLGFADALAAGAIAAKLGGAVLLTDGSDQSPATARYLAAHHPDRYAIGGPAVIADSGATPIFGADRYETAVLAALRFFPDVEIVAFASGASYPDALAGGAHAALAGAPLLLVPPDGSLPISLTILFRDLATDPPVGFLFGGAGAVSEAVASELLIALGG